MPQFRQIISLVLRISFVVLIAILMILWIVLATQTVQEIKDLEMKDQAQRNERNKIYDKRAIDRVKGMTIFNTILEEVIALLAILGVLFSHRYLLQTSMVLLSIIWFLAHYRISDLLWLGSPVMIASHVIHFIVICIGLSFAYFVKESKNSNEKCSKIFNTDNTTTPVVTTKPA